MNVQDAAIQILKAAGKPLHAKEIAERIMEAGLWSSDGKTPEATVSARLYSDIKKYGDQSTFVKVAPQTFFLRDTQIVAVCDANNKSIQVCFRTDCLCGQMPLFPNIGTSVLRGSRAGSPRYIVPRFSFSSFLCLW
ncbi:MAG: hypothetical protein EOL87_11230 [Spartobacteria bacterium]|nr:hypothetical protein [Spartobacteria bacterium]